MIRGLLLAASREVLDPRRRSSTLQSVGDKWKVASTSYHATSDIAEDCCAVAVDRDLFDSNITSSTPMPYILYHSPRNRPESVACDYLYQICEGSFDSVCSNFVEV
jgi:hypothetical protein